MKSFINTFFIATAVVAVSSCVPKATEKKAICGTNQAFNSVTRNCYSIEEVRKVPVGTTSSVSTSEEGVVRVSLAYTDANKDLAKSCNVDASTGSGMIEAISPVVADRSIFTTANSLLSTLATIQGYIGAPALSAKTAMDTSLALAKNNFYQATVQTQLAIFQANANTLIGIAATNVNNPQVQPLYPIAQQKFAEFNSLYTSMNNLCSCSGGVCTTIIVPKLNKNGVTGFTYTITDVDGASLPKSVAVNISAASLTQNYLRPVAASKYIVAAESSTSASQSYTFSLPVAADLAGTGSAMKYKFGGSKNTSGQGLTTRGIVTGCMDLSGTTSDTDTSCIYTATNGDANDSTIGAGVATKASASINTLTYTANSEGTIGNKISIQYIHLSSGTTNDDIKKYGLITGSNEAYLKVESNPADNTATIKVYLNPFTTTGDMIKALINSHLQASKLVTVTGTYSSIPTETTVSLSGGVDAFDTIPFKASNGTADSVLANVMVSMTATDDTPMVPKTYNALFSQTETFLEEETRAITLTFKDVDTTTGFTFQATIDGISPTCNSATDGAAFALLTPSTNLTLGAIPAPVCAAGTCTVAITTTAQLNFAGSACLYYRVNDGSSTSDVQYVNVNVTNINDAPQISSAALPTITALGSASVNEDLASGLPSYKDIYVGPGGGQWEASQLLTITLTSSNTTLIPNTVCKNYTPGTTSPVGAVTPTAAGLYYLDKTNMACYVSTGTTATSWKLYPSLTAYPACAYNYFGQGSPVGAVTPAAANNLYLDTTNNKCYKAASTSSSSWAQDATVSNYKVIYVPTADKSGTTNITVNVKDNGGTANSASDNTSDVLALTVNYVDDPPVFLSTITSVETNEGGAVQSDGFQVDEDAGSTADEDAQAITISSITSDNSSVLPVSAIKIFYDLNDNGVEDSGESRAVGAMLEASAGDDAKLHKFYLKLDPVDGVSGNANIALTISDGTNTATTNFSFIVHPIAALHGGWQNISSVGVKTDKNGAPVTVSDIQCNYNKTTDAAKCSGANCTGTVSPNATIIPDAANVIYWDSSSQRCYRSTGTTAYSWVDMNTSCPISRASGSCSDNNCIVDVNSTSPLNTIIPSYVGQYYYNGYTNKCYVSTATAANTNWIEYIPAKVTLAWKPFIIVGSGPDSGVQIGGWNVYRREAGADYNFKGGHLKNNSSTAVYTITDPTVRTFTDTTAVAGKVYYYVVRPVDSIKKFPTYTPEAFSEVRVLAAPTNYSFVHRWIVNQEICNSMNITNTTSPYAIDQTQNFRCPYHGPGESLTTPGYYDYGKDLLVDTQEAGCPYAAAPKCSANGCVGIGDPSNSWTGLAANDLYYDRSAGTCWQSNGSAWAKVQSATIVNSVAQKMNTALNAPLVNITAAKAATICSVRTAPSGTSLKASWASSTAVLPSKKDYMAYSSQKLNMTDPEVTEMEQGFSLNIQSRCNGSSASGLDTAFTDSNIPSTSFIYSLPGTYSSGIRSLYTGSIPWGSNKGTDACVSRFGIQDLYGNVAEWTTDKLSCRTSDKTCTSAAMGASYSSYNFATTGGPTYYALDMVTGPFNDTNTTIVGPDSSDTFLTSWIFSDELFEAGKFSFPTALPINDNIGTVSEATYVKNSLAVPFMLDIGPSSGITVNKLHEDGIIINGAQLIADATAAAGGTAQTVAQGTFAVGGSYKSGNLAGRYTSELIQDSIIRPEVGMRCIVPIAPTDYDMTLETTTHAYPY